MQGAEPIVTKGNIVRKGRGYSLAELKEADLDLRSARNDGVSVDVWRRTKHQENVEQLRSIAKISEVHRSTKKDKKKKD
jgi:ribosomal protein L13E